MFIFCRLIRKLITKLILKHKDCVEKVFVLLLSLFYGYLVLIFSVISIIRNRSHFFQVKRRPFPPDCLTDPSLGTHHFIQLNDIRLHYVSAGDEDKQLILFIHGFPEFWYSWRHQMREFCSDYYVLSIDQRGYGESDKPNGIHNYTIDKMVEDVRQLLEVLNKNHIILVGHDWGGAVAWNFAAKHPELLEKLIILNSPHPLVFREVIKSSWKQFFSSWYMFFFNLPLLPELVLLSNDLKIIEKYFQSSDGHTICTPEDIEAYKYMLCKHNGLNSPLNYYRAVIRKYPSVPPISYQITVPTLIIWGKRDIALTPRTAEAHKYVDQLTIKYIENCSHWTQLDQPSIVNQYINDFINN